MGCSGKCGWGEYMRCTLQQVCTVGNLGRTCTYKNTTSTHSVVLSSTLVWVTWCCWLGSNVARIEGASLTCCWRGDHGRRVNVSPHLLYVFLNVPDVLAGHGGIFLWLRTNHISLAQILLSIRSRATQPWASWFPIRLFSVKINSAAFPFSFVVT